jgi:LmbE family N-acetylglucosaminyl deacetylase
MGDSILVVAAHPDDEVLAVGGTLARYADAGDVMQLLTVAEGATCRQEKRDREESANELFSLAKAAQAAGRILGAAAVELLSLPDNWLDTLDRLDLIKQIKQRVDLHKRQGVNLYYEAHTNTDYPRLLSFEVVTSAEWQQSGLASAFQPNWFVDISAQCPPVRLMPLKTWPAGVGSS